MRVEGEPEEVAEFYKRLDTRSSYRSAAVPPLIPALKRKRGRSPVSHFAAPEPSEEWWEKTGFMSGPKRISWNKAFHGGILDFIASKAKEGASKRDIIDLIYNDLRSRIPSRTAGGSTMTPGLSNRTLRARVWSKVYQIYPRLGLDKKKPHDRYMTLAELPVSDILDSSLESVVMRELVAGKSLQETIDGILKELVGYANSRGLKVSEPILRAALMAKVLKDDETGGSGQDKGIAGEGQPGGESGAGTGGDVESVTD